MYYSFVTPLGSLESSHLAKWSHQYNNDLIMIIMIIINVQASVGVTPEELRLAQLMDSMVRPILRTKERGGQRPEDQSVRGEGPKIQRLHQL